MGFQWDFVGAASFLFQDVFSPVQIEELAARVGLALEIERGFQNIVLESDSLQVISALNSSSVDLFGIGPIIEVTKKFMHMTAEASASYVRRHANSVTHRIARFALHTRGNSLPPLVPPSLFSAFE